MKKWTLITSVCITACMIGCMTGPKYKKPSVETPKKYKEAGTEWAAADPKDNMLKGKWWESFNDPDLNILEEQVNVSNQNIAASFANLKQAKALIKAARAQYYPTISLSPSATVQKGTVSQESSSTTNLFSIPVEASWVPDLWGRVQSTVDQNVAKAQLSAADLENVRLAQQADLAVTYYELRSQDELIQLFDATVKAYVDSLNLNKVLLNTGIGSEEAVAQAETQLRTTEAQATSLRIARAQFEHAIALLIGKPASDFAIKPAYLKVIPPQVPLSLPSQILERRPDIASAERNMAAANATIGIATSAYYPQLTLSGIAGISSNTVQDLVKTPNFFWSLGATLSETIFDGGARSATVEQFTAAYEQTVAIYRQTVLTAFQQVEDALSNSRLLETQLQQQDQAVLAAQNYLRLANSRFQLGIDPYLNVLTAQILLLSNQQTALNLRAQRLTSSIRLIEALGGGWDVSKIPTEKELLSDSSNKSEKSKPN